MNPLTMLKYKMKLEKNHPKAAEFVKKVLMTGLPEGTVIEMTVTKPGESPKTANLKIMRDDLDMLDEVIKENKKQMTAEIIAKEMEEEV